jgi:hypothetical protein
LLALLTGLAASAAAEETKVEQTALAEATRGGPQTLYAATVSHGEGAGFLVSHFWSKGPLFRSETVIAGRNVITIVNGASYYIIDGLAGYGIAIRRPPAAVAADAQRPRPFGIEKLDILKAGGEKVRTERAGAAACDVYRVTDEDGRRQVCVSQDEWELPIKLETFRRASGRTTKMDYVNWLKGLSIPDAFFEVGPEIELEHIETDDYFKRSQTERVGPAPVLYRRFLYSER